jgi:hypothetical protein
MKHTVSQDAPAFHPIHITLELESQKEADLIAAMLNFAPLIEALRELGMDLLPLRCEIRDFGINPSLRVNDITNAFRNTDWFKHETGR